MLTAAAHSIWSCSAAWQINILLWYAPAGQLGTSQPVPWSPASLSQSHLFPDAQLISHRALRGPAGLRAGIAVQMLPRQPQRANVKLQHALRPAPEVVSSVLQLRGACDTAMAARVACASP